MDEISKKLIRNGFEVTCFQNKEQAATYLKTNIKNKTVGFGDSETLHKMDMEKLLSENNKVFNPYNKDEEQFYEIAKKALTTDIFLTSVNSISVTGEIVNMDDTGNRIAGSLFGHEKIYYVIGKNKICDSLEDAMYRVRNYVAPQNTKRLKTKTPCVKTGKCYDCNSKERICNSMNIIFKKLNGSDAEIIFIDEELGI